MKKLFFLVLISLNLILHFSSIAQNYWNPDSSAYKYFCRGENADQFINPPLTSVAIDTSVYRNSKSSINWKIPANSGTAILKLDIGDIDLRNKVVYTVCKVDKLLSPINVFVYTSNGTKFKVETAILTSSVGLNLPPDEWHQLGSFIASNPINGASPSDLEHSVSIAFETNNTLAEMNLWIDEIKYISPRGPVCIVHFNRFREQTDSLLTPYLHQKGIKANIDFNFDFAKRQFVEIYSNLSLRQVGLSRIDSLIKDYSWSCTSHGTFYDLLPYLNFSERYELCHLDSFIANNFNAQWCFSIPKDVVTPSILKEIKHWNIYKTIRKQGYSFNELPIDNPDFLRFFRPTSANAGPNIGGTPLTISQMKSYVDKVKSNAGLIILDFGTIVTAPSNLYTDVETTLYSDATQLIDYVDSSGLTFLNFEELFRDDTSYVYAISANNDYYIIDSSATINFNVLTNDFINNSTAISLLNQPNFGTIVLLPNSTFEYAPNNSCFNDDHFSYVISDGINSDTATVFIHSKKLNIQPTKLQVCNPVTYVVKPDIKGGYPPFSYSWSNSSISDSIIASGNVSYTLTVTDAKGCIDSISFKLPNRVSPLPFVTNSIECSAGVPTCSAISDGTIMWYDSLVGGQLLQTGGNTFLSPIQNSTKFYVLADYGNCKSNRTEVSADIQKPFVEITASTDTIICQGRSTRLVSDTDPEILYQWYKDSLPMVGENSRFYQARESGSFYLEVIRTSDNCSSFSNSIFMNILDTPAVSVVSSTQFCLGDSVELVTPFVLYNSYQWYRNNVALVNDTLNNLFVKDSGFYKVEINNSLTCSLFSDSVETTINCVVGLSTVNSNSFSASLFPNPISNESNLALSFNKMQTVNISIVDVQGRIIETVFVGTIYNDFANFKINKDEYLPGIYFVRIQTESGTRIFKMIVAK